MKFSQFIAIIAIISMAAQANAYNDGALRRSGQVAQSDQAEPSSASGVVILNTNSNTNSNSATAAQSQQPTTVVEAAPATESKAELLRRERVNAEVQTEQKIVEKLEDSRLQEERARADRLFGNKLDPQPAPAAAVAPAAQAAPAAAAVVEEKEKPVRPTQVTIEKVEIIQPKEDKKEEKAEEFKEVKKEEKHEAVVESKMVAPVVQDKEESQQRYYVTGQVGNLNYNASNVKSNYGLGVSIGTLIDNRWAIELGYFYSNHYIDTFWVAPLYSQLDQNDISASAKYYILSGKLKPYVGGGLTYINRQYTDRVRNGSSWYANNSTTSETTQAVDLGLMAGLDFMVSENIIIGGGFEYNFNVMNTNEIDWKSNYGLPDNSKELEKINYTTLKISAKYLF